jgi:hypothetical protein
MAEIWKPQPNEVYLAWCKAIFKDALETMSDWELKFVQSMHLTAQLGHTFTQAQAEKLEDIYVKYTS